MRSGPGAARTILLMVRTFLKVYMELGSYFLFLQEQITDIIIISARPSKQPRMVRTFLKVYMELGSYFLFLQEQIKDIIIGQSLYSNS